MMTEQQVEKLFGETMEAMHQAREHYLEKKKACSASTPDGMKRLAESITAQIALASLVGQANALIAVLDRTLEDVLGVKS
jgi:hypothetical protein